MSDGPDITIDAPPLQDMLGPEAMSGLPEGLLKVPPHSIEAEQAVIGGLMLDSTAWDQVAGHVVANDFYRKNHQRIFDAISRLADNGDAVDVITLSELLEQHGELNEAGGMAYLAELAKNTPSAANVRNYAKIVRDRAVLRELISASSHIADAAYNPEGRTTSELLDHAEQLVFDIAEQGARSQKGFVSVKDLSLGAIERIEELFASDSPITGLSTGFADLDDMTSGLQSSDLIIVAGRPSMGKTSFAMNLAENAAIDRGLPVAIFSMEMSGEQLVMRMMSSLGRIDQTKVRSGKLHEDDWPRLTSAIGILSETKLFIDETPALTPTDLRARARRLKRENPELGLIVIDYLQLMQVPGSGENRATEISEISRSLKALAKELNVPIIALSQLNRSLEQRPNKRPVMSDLRESGAIEQDADLIMFIYRDEVYNEDSQDQGIAEIIIGKQRNGPIGAIRLAFLGQYTRFENLAREYNSGNFE